MKYKMIIFDLDGTILNTLRDLQAATNAALQVCNLPPISLEQTKKYIGHGIKNLLLQASNNYEQIDSILDSFKKYYSVHYNDFTTEYDGIKKVIQYCQEKDMTLGVLTNKVENIAIPLVEAHFPQSMDFIYGEVSGRPRKPNPTFILSILNERGCCKEDVLYIGDSEVDVQTCKNAGIDGVFVSYGFRDKETLLEYTDKVIDSAEDIINYLVGEE